MGETFDAFPDGRKGRNTTYEVADAAAGAFGDLLHTVTIVSWRINGIWNATKGGNNATSLFGVRTRFRRTNRYATYLT